MTIKIYQDKIEIGGYTLQETPTGFSVNGYFDANLYSIPASTGYSSGGYGPPPNPSLGVNTIDKFPFSTPFATATDVGDLSQLRHGLGGHSSNSQAFSSGGSFNNFGNVRVNTIDKFPFSTPFTTATDAGDLGGTRNLVAGHSSSTDGYTSGGYSVGDSDTIYKFPFSTPFTTATTVGNLSQARSSLSGHSSGTDGYASGGSTPANSNRIDKFPFSTPFTTATNIGSLGTSRSSGAGQSSSTDGYTSGGESPIVARIDKFPFASSPVTATNVGNLSQARSRGAGQSSINDGYTSGGYIVPLTNLNTIDKFPFSTPFTSATDIGDLSQHRRLLAGHQG